MPRPRCRRGTVTVELLLNLPIWVILVLAVAQFGEMSCNVQRVSLASRMGAEEAAYTLPLPAAGGVPDNVLYSIQRELAVAGLTWSQVVLEHNLGDTPVTLVSGSGRCDPPGAPEWH